MTGYLESDFLGVGISSNNNQSNSYVLRQRQVWGQAALNNGWAFTGGQMWSLVTETKIGEDNRTEALPMTIDPQYTVGFSWARQYGFRVTKNFNNKVWAGFAVENSQETITTHGNVTDSFLLGSQGNAGGLYNPGINGCSLGAGATMGAPGVTTAVPTSPTTPTTRRRTSLENWSSSRALDTMKSSASAPVPRPHLPQCRRG